MILAVASHKKRARAQVLDPLGANALSAGVLLFIALLWLIWLIAVLLKR
ncbi:MAG: hypothetical protein ABIQ12_15070 [Opitutaceae bacterium]